jgi:D-aminopeptidase
LLRGCFFDGAGVDVPLLAADTRAMPDGTEGYEGNPVAGFRTAENRILWTGDAGMAASLDDMIAWERHIDATRDDPDGLYNRLSAPVAFSDGAAAPYGFGLGRGREFGRAVTGHGGALRGWRSHRLHVADGRISIVVMFNHMGDAQAAALDALAAVLDEARPRPEPLDGAPPDWLGAYIEPESGLAVRIDTPGGGLRLRFGHGPERLDLLPDGSASNGRTRLRPAADGLWMDRPQENMSSRLQPLRGEALADIAGRFHCAELDAELLVTDAGGAIFGGFSGFLGQGRMEMLEPLGPDTWALPCPRALDHTPPGDWTLTFRRAPGGEVTEVVVGCWLARGLRYRRMA